MRSLLTTVLVARFLGSGVMAALVCFAASPDGDQQAVLRADHDLVRALARTDKAEVERLLDADFTWISTDGRNQSRDDILRVMPKPLASDGGDAKVSERTYGQVGLVVVDRERAHVMRLWVKRKAGWRALHFNEILQPASQATAARGGGA